MADPQPAHPAADPLGNWRALAAGPHRRRRSMPRWTGPLTAAIVAVGVVVVAPGAPDRRRPPSTGAPVPAPSTTVLSRAPGGALPDPGPGPGPVQPALSPLGASASDAPAYQGGVLSWAGTRWEVGREGDVVALGDWDCDARPTVALLRPSTGAVYRFPGWPPDGAVVAASPARRLPGARRLVAGDLDGDRCDDLVVEDLDGPLAVIPGRGPAEAAPPPG